MLGLDGPDGIKTIDELHQAIKKLIGTEATIGVSHGGDEGQFLNVDVLVARTGKPDVAVDSSDLPEPGTAATGSFAAAAGIEDEDDEELPY